MCPILGPLVPLFWISSGVSSGFQSQSGLPYSHCRGERNVRTLSTLSGTYALLIRKLRIRTSFFPNVWFEYLLEPSRKTSHQRY